MTDTIKATVAGAGVAGLSVATALAARGHSVRVAERAPEIREVGAGLQISPNGVRVLDALGLGEALRAAALRIERVRLIDGLTGREVVTLDLAGRGDDMPWFAVHRAELIELLRDGAERAGAAIETGAEIAPPPEGRALDGDDLLIGADGLKSAVRKRVDEP